MLAMGLIIVLAVILLPSWGIEWGIFIPTNVDPERIEQVRDVFDDVMNQMASCYLLAALGFCLVLRCGMIDLSIWSVSGLSGVLAALLINAGIGPVAAFATAISAGLAIGALNGFLATRTRIPSFIITLVTAALTMWLAQSLAAERTVDVDESTFGRWHIRVEAKVSTDGNEKTKANTKDSSATGKTVTNYRMCSPAVTRMLLVGVGYSLTMIIILIWGMAERHRRMNPGRWRVFFAMAASGALAAASGALWMIDHNSAPAPERIVGDLRIPAAALLAGGALLIGPGRTLLVGLFLPISLLLVTIWRQEVLPLNFLQGFGYATQTALLAAMVLTIYAGFTGLLQSRGKMRAIYIACFVTAVCGIILTAMQTRENTYDARRIRDLLGISLWLLSVVRLTIIQVQKRLKKTTTVASNQ